MGTPQNLHTNLAFKNLCQGAKQPKKFHGEEKRGGTLNHKGLGVKCQWCHILGVRSWETDIIYWELIPPSLPQFKNGGIVGRIKWHNVE